MGTRIVCIAYILATQFDGDVVVLMLTMFEVKEVFGLLTCEEDPSGAAKLSAKPSPASKLESRNYLTSSQHQQTSPPTTKMSIIELPSPPKDAISAVRFSPDNSTLLVSSWDRGVHIYTRNPQDSSLSYSRTFSLAGPVLDVAWHTNSQTFYVVGLDRDVSEFDITKEASDERILSSHGKGANKVAYSSDPGLVISVGWDERMHVHDPESGDWVNIALIAKAYALSCTDDRLVVVMAERKVHVFELQTLRDLVDNQGSKEKEQQAREVGAWQQRESSLKFMARDVACMPDGTGFTTGSIEGRVGVEWFDEEANKNTYAFKCHRDKTTTTNENGEAVPLDIIYPVNAIAFHPVQQSTFATGGGDGVVALWDAKTKRRIRQYAKLVTSVAAMEFSPDGKNLAIGMNGGFEDGHEQDELDPDFIKVYIRTLGENEAKGKPAKEK